MSTLANQYTQYGRAYHTDAYAACERYGRFSTQMQGLLCVHVFTFHDGSRVEFAGGPHYWVYDAQ